MGDDKNNGKKNSGSELSHLFKKDTEVFQLSSHEIIKNQTDNLKVYTLEVVNDDSEWRGKKWGFIYKLKVGREVGDRGLSFDDSKISSVHCAFSVTDNNLYVVDLGSRNGTYLAGERLKPDEPHKLISGDILLIGNLEIRTGMIRCNELMRDEVKILDEPRLQEFLQSRFSNSPSNRSSSTFDSFENSEGKKKNIFNSLTTYFSGGKIKVEKKRKNLSVGSFMGKKKFLISGPFLRMWSLIGDFAISSALHLFCYRQFDLYRKVVSDSWGMSEKGWGMIPPHSVSYLSTVTEFVDRNLLETFFPFLFSYFVFSLATTFLFGVTFCQRLMGIQSWGNFFKIRFMGILRVVLGIMMAPFIIFDLPCWFKMRTVKEFMTFTAMEADQGYWGRFFPVMLSLMLISSSLFVHKMECLQANNMTCNMEQEVEVAMNRSVDDWINFHISEKNLEMISQKIDLNKAVKGVKALKMRNQNLEKIDQEDSENYEQKK